MNYLSTEIFTVICYCLLLLFFNLLLIKKRKQLSGKNEFSFLEKKKKKKKGKKRKKDVGLEFIIMQEKEKGAETMCTRQRSKMSTSNNN